MHRSRLRFPDEIEGGARDGADTVYADRAAARPADRGAARQPHGAGDHRLGPRARESSLKQNLQVMRKAIDDFYADNGVYPPTLEALGGKTLYPQTAASDPVTERADSWVLIRVPRWPERRGRRYRRYSQRFGGQRQRWHTVSGICNCIFTRKEVNGLSRFPPSLSAIGRRGRADQPSLRSWSPIGQLRAADQGWPGGGFRLVKI